MARNIPKMLGTSGLDISLDGVIREEFLPNLQWPQAGEVYKEMGSNDPTIGAMLFAIEKLIQGVTWSVAPGVDSERGNYEAELLDSILHDMDKPWEETISDIMSFLQYGFSIHEPIFKIRRGPKQSNPKFKSKFTDGKFGLRKLAGRSQSSIYRWEVDPETMEISGVWQWVPNSAKRVFLPKDRYIHFRANSKRDNPESTSILRNAYRPWFFKKSIEETEALGIARDLAGIPVMTAPIELLQEDASPSEKAFREHLKDIVTGIANNEQSGVLIPAAFDDMGNKLITLELLNSSGKRQFDTDKIIQRYSSQIAQTVLADFIMLGQTTFGSFALSSNKTKLFAAALGAWLKNIANTLNNQLIPKLAELNDWDFENLPKIVPGDLEGRDLNTVANYFSSLKKEGLIRPDAGLEGFLRNIGDAPQFDESVEIEIESQEDSPEVESTEPSDQIVSPATESGKPTGDAIAGD